MNKFLIGAAIGGLSSYMLHRKAMQILKATTQFTQEFSEPPRPQAQKPDLRVVS